MCFSIYFNSCTIYKIYKIFDVIIILYNNFFYNFKAQTVKTQTLGDVGYDLQGNVVSTLSLPNPEVKTTDRLSANGNAANRAFRACYDMNFFQE